MTIAAAALLILALAGPAEAKPPKPCARKGSTTVASSKSVRVYQVKNKDGGNNLFGCLRSNDKRQVLAKGYDDGFVTSGTYERVKVAGRFVAWQYVAIDESCKAGCPPGYNSRTVHLSIRDLRKPKTAHVEGEVAQDGRLVLTTGGAIAWSQNGQAKADVEINAFDAAGRRTLDHGQIPPRSLQLQGRTASWTNAGQPRSALLASRT